MPTEGKGAHPCLPVEMNGTGVCVCVFPKNGFNAIACEGQRWVLVKG